MKLILAFIAAMIIGSFIAEWVQASAGSAIYCGARPYVPSGCVAVCKCWQGNCGWEIRCEH